MKLTVCAEHPEVSRTVTNRTNNVDQAMDIQMADASAAPTTHKFKGQHFLVAKSDVLPQNKAFTSWTLCVRRRREYLHVSQQPYLGYDSIQVP
eukprot:3749425-Amphidinium_carterae.1